MWVGGSPRRGLTFNGRLAIRCEGGVNATIKRGRDYSEGGSHPLRGFSSRSPGGGEGTQEKTGIPR